MFGKLRDPINGLTHFIGAFLAVAGLVLLICKSVYPSVKPLHIMAFSIFGAGMILLYTSSTLYHWLPLTERGVRHLRRIDHMMIFLLIAASYTPVCLILLKGGWGWSLFGCIWGFAVLGILLKVFWLQAPRWLYTVVYIVMGWLAIVALWPLAKVLSLGGFLWLFAGGLFYTFGAVIYATKKPNPWPKVIGFHEIFHVFVMLGSFSHFWLMYRYIAPFD